MKYFLLLIILALCGGGYYEYTVLQQKQDAQSAADQKQIDDLNGQIEQLKAEKKKTQDNLDAANQDLNAAKTQLTDLTAQLLALQKAAEAAKKAATQTASQSGEVKPAPVLSNFLGTIVTLDGKTFQNCKLLKVEADGITFNHSEGITKVTFILLPPDLAKKFGFDIHKETQLSPDEVEAQETLRIKADLQPSAQSPSPAQP
ncbi:MAG: hypothetical protein LV481_05880 [Methylacidiphilales bacterium]|nr:hypothetical protein [Candidatus Methylacidiphilales bacterium]